MFARTFAKTSILVAAVVAAGMLLPVVAQASELVMFEQAGCVYCQRWDRDVGSLYGKTPEAQALPLRRIDIQNQRSSGVTLASPIRYTPTFVVVDNGREVGRITGYSNDDSFWGLLDALAAKLAPPLHETNRI
ncbi:thioredoxin fold domain-containing protein [Bradyrhizobium sp. SYSU BS000235]|uniref:thioredoxin fold domain-containing protein n=1 Tax=Bradyrhizobium sp. SYSU BS000235 TaxID=3411332 RepID=UPI003C79395E